MSPPLVLFLAGLLTCVARAWAQLPYNPTRIVSSQDGTFAYLLSPQQSSSQFSLDLLDTSDQVNATSQCRRLYESLPFLSAATPQAVIALSDTGDLAVMAGSCEDDAKDLALWRFTVGEDKQNGTWSPSPLTATDSTLALKYLSAGFEFSPTGSSAGTSLYVFGGMCPTTPSPDATTWISDATYSNTMLTIAPDPDSGSNSPYQLSLTGARAPPIAEAGLTITPLSPSFSNTSDGHVAQQQNFVLLGGHTQTAFINMSQLAIFSLPQASWAFVGVPPAPGPSSARMARRGAAVVEPRSGHTALLTDDGSKIVVLGGWVGDTSTPAQPQLIVLEVGQGYGGNGDWAWTAPSPANDPFATDKGIFGHGVAMLPGGVMMVAGGFSIDTSGSKTKRDPSHQLLFLNTTTLDWTTTYTNPYPEGSSPGAVPVQPSATGLKPSEKAGLGAGLGLGLAAAASVAVVWLLYSRKLRARRAVREKELRELALGAERYRSPTPVSRTEQDHGDRRTASWSGMQERQVEHAGNPFPWAPVALSEQPGRLHMQAHHGIGDDSRYAERTGVAMDVPSPTRGLRKNLGNRPPPGPGPFNQHPPGVPGSVFRIEEEEENSQSGSLRRARLAQSAGDRRSVVSDPFKDPPASTEDGPDYSAAQRKKELEGWVDDWQSAAETMSLSRSTSQAQSRTYSSVSRLRSQPHGTGSGRGSPEKSDRTGSNLSDDSITTNSSLTKSGGSSLSRNISQRSVSAGYALFSGAAAAMRGLGYSRQPVVPPSAGGSLARAPSNRSVSLDTESAGHKYRAEPFSSTRGAWAAAGHHENQALLSRSHQRPPLDGRDYSTMTESVGRNKYSGAGSLTSGRRAMTLLGSVKRVFTGTGNVDVQDRVSALEGSSSHSSPTKRSMRQEMVETSPDRSLSTGTSFWVGKRGAKDWDSDMTASGDRAPSSSVRGPAIPGLVINDDKGAIPDDDEDWDIETAVQKRVVQVMFTVPKEKLRVVNADALSLLSSNRSEADHEEDKDRDHQIKRMSSVREGDEASGSDLEESEGKGKEREG